MNFVCPEFKYVTPMNTESVENIMNTIEQAYRICYASEPNGNRDDFIKSKIAMKHESPLEHPVISIEVITNRGVSHEIVRHRIAAYSQQSTRYCNYSKNKFGNEITFMKPSWVSVEDILNYRANELDTNTPAYIFLKSCEDSEKAYMTLLEMGWKPEEGREVLNNALATKLMITYNIREWRHFFNLRVLGTTGKPHPNMVATFAPVLKDFAKMMPTLFGDLWETYCKQIVTEEIEIERN